MLLRRLIFVVSLALLAALAAQAVPAMPRGALVWQGRLRPVSQERVQARPRAGQARRQQRVQARRQANKANRAAANRAAHGYRGAQANGGFQRFGGANHSAPGNAGQFNRAGNGGVARPPNQQFFNPNPSVVRRFPAGTMQRLRQMSPQQQERFFQNNQRFQSLPPARQAQIRQNFQRWNNLSPAQKDQFIHRNQVLQRLSPEQRQLYQSQILPRWQQLSPDRRQVIIGRLHTLQGMTPDQQQKALNDPRFMLGLSPDEQGVLRNLSSLRNQPQEPRVVPVPNQQ
ncbi:MAG TPA: DUF3106 domain-containing protein [Candidatus Acidoferrum sp.]|nr:DUF3106 domain-containing protein [Candidatus Acidoferrum sp.]